MSVMWLLLDGKKGLVYQRPEIIGDFLDTPSRFPRRRCLIATLSAELYRSTCFVGWRHFLNTVQLFQTRKLSLFLLYVIIKTG